ncbi:MAG: hypothetical protein AAGB22_09330, partial [Bacteroidota bacterium]
MKICADRFMPRRRRGTVSIVALSITTMMWYGCNGPKPYYNKAEKDWSSRTAPAAKPTNSIFLIGDAGKSREASPALQLLSTQLAEAGSSGTALFLGNNI